MTNNYYQNLLLDLNHEEHPFEENNLSLNLSQASIASSSSSSLAPKLFNLSQDQEIVACSFVESKPLLQRQEVVHNLIPCGASWKSKQERNGLELTISKREGKIGDNQDHDHDHKDHHGDHQSGTSSSRKWMSSKMRMLKKVIKAEDQTFIREASNNNHSTMNFAHHNIKHEASSTEITAGNSTNNMNSPTMRSCVDCNTTRTPLWRSGPQGPKSLCNACGIRLRKARRAAMAMANEAPTNNTTSKLNARKETEAQQMKKRSKTSKKAVVQNNQSPNNKKVCFEEFALSLSKKLSLHQVFPPDEKEAAILLMAMSCGLVES